MDYFDNYKSERYHDANLIALVEYLSSKGKTSLISDEFILEMSDIGQYRAGQTKKDYDVHLDFKKAAICIETKVDSCEGEYDDPLPYQTQRIYNKYKDEYSKKTFFRYITYGASEFYIKRTENKSFTIGPYSRDFKLIPLSNIIRMIEDSGILKESQTFNKSLIVHNRWQFLFLLHMGIILQSSNETLHGK